MGQAEPPSPLWPLQHGCLHTFQGTVMTYKIYLGVGGTATTMLMSHTMALMILTRPVSIKGDMGSLTPMMTRSDTA